MEDYNIAFYTLGITLSASACAWVANVLYTQYEFMKSNRVNRYKDALSSSIGHCTSASRNCSLTPTRMATASCRSPR
jgi:hypothetical protein